MVINKARIPKIKFRINAHGLNFGFLVVIGNIIAAPNQPAERLINKSDNACSQSITFQVYQNINEKPFLWTFKTMGFAFNSRPINPTFNLDACFSP